MAQKIADVLQVDIMTLLYGSASFSLTENERHLIEAYRNNENFRQSIDGIMGMLGIEKKTNGNSIKEIS